MGLQWLPQSSKCRQQVYLQPRSIQPQHLLHQKLTLLWQWYVKEIFENFGWSIDWLFFIHVNVGQPCWDFFKTATTASSTTGSVTLIVSRTPILFFKAQFQHGLISTSFASQKFIHGTASKAHPKVRLCGDCVQFSCKKCKTRVCSCNSISLWPKSQIIDLPWSLDLRDQTSLYRGVNHLHLRPCWHRDLRLPSRVGYSSPSFLTRCLITEFGFQVHPAANHLPLWAWDRPLLMERGLPGFKLYLRVIGMAKYRLALLFRRQIINILSLIKTSTRAQLFHPVCLHGTNSLRFSLLRQRPTYPLLVWFLFRRPTPGSGQSRDHLFDQVSNHRAYNSVIGENF